MVSKCEQLITYYIDFEGPMHENNQCLGNLLKILEFFQPAFLKLGLNLLFSIIYLVLFSLSFEPPKILIHESAWLCNISKSTKQNIDLISFHAIVYYCLTQKVLFQKPHTLPENLLYSPSPLSPQQQCTSQHRRRRTQNNVGGFLPKSGVELQQANTQPLISHWKQLH